MHIEVDNSKKNVKQMIEYEKCIRKYENRYST